MAEHRSVYARAHYYDIVFRRDVGKEVAFLIALYERLVGGRPRSALEIACGPGYHARALARQGLRVYGLDLEPEMIACAAEQAREEGVDVAWLVADMRSFHLPEPVDLAFCGFDGLDALLTAEDVVTHFQAVAANLTGKGLYVVQLTHPRYASFYRYGPFRYVGERDGVRVEILWGTNNPQFDLVTGVAEVEVEVHVREGDHEILIRDRAKERFFTPQELALLARLAGVFTPVAWFGDFDLSQPLDNSPQSQYLIAVMQKLE